MADRTIGIKQKFIERFGESDAEAIEAAAVSHANGINSADTGSDFFRWALIICIGHDCMSNSGYRSYHGIEADWKDLKVWIKAEARLGEHQGDIDYLAAMTRRYEGLI